MFDITYLAPTRLSLCQKIIWLKTVVESDALVEVHNDDEFMRRLDPSTADVEGQFCPTLIEAMTKGRFGLAYNAFTGHEQYREQDQCCKFISTCLLNLGQFFPNIDKGSLNSKEVLNSYDTINEYQAFMQNMKARAEGAPDVLQRIE